MDTIRSKMSLGLLPGSFGHPKIQANREYTEARQTKINKPRHNPRKNNTNDPEATPTQIPEPKANNPMTKGVKSVILERGISPTSAPKVSTPMRLGN
jgi:hypothetical protein